MLKRALATLAALTLGLSAALVGAALPASAHEPLVKINCGSVWYGFQDYAKPGNVFKLYVDDMVTPALEVTFDQNLLMSPQFDLEPTSAHVVRYTIDAADADPKYDFVSTPVVTTPCKYNDQKVVATCTRVVVGWGGPLDPSLAVDVTLTTPTGDKRVSAQVITGVAGGLGPDGLGVRYTDPTGATTEQPLTELAVKSGDFVFSYRDLAGNPLPYRASVALGGVAVVTLQDLQCGFQSITVSASPSFTPPTCTAGGTLTLPPVTGVTWTGGRQGDGPGTYTVVAVPDFGITIDGQSTFPITVPGPDLSKCQLITHPTVTPTATFTAGSCTAGGSYDLSATPGVQWLVNGNTVGAGVHKATPDTTVQVQATLIDPVNYGWNDPRDPTQWTFTFSPWLVSCALPTLPFTGSGGTIALGIAAGLLLSVGAAAYLIRRRARI